jgi:hypothetical protein
MKAPAKKTLGLDGIPNGILHKVLNQILPHLKHLFNACLRTGYYPKHFRTSIIAVLRKEGKESYQSAKLYRPIALLNTIGKALESILACDEPSLLALWRLSLPVAGTGVADNQRSKRWFY